MNTKTAICFLKRLKLFGKWTLIAKDEDIALVPMCKVDIEALNIAITALKEQETIETWLLSSCDRLESSKDE